MNKDYFAQRKTSIIITILLMIVGSITYLMIGNTSMSGGTMGTSQNGDNSELFKDIQLKAAYDDTGAIKIFALTKNNYLKDYSSSNGNNIPESDSMVIGSDEARMMISEKLFSKPGDELKGLFGINTTVEGILDTTGTFADDFHFLSSEQYYKLQGDPDVLSVRFKDGAPKLFYLYDKSNPSPAKIELTEGNMNLFYTHLIGNKVYYPVIIGAKEAKMMQEEKLFNKTGDTIDGFFGKNVMIVGIVKETNTGLDMMHIVEKDFFDTSVVEIKGELV